MTAPSIALADCGPCLSDGPLVRDHLPPTLSPQARALCLTRLEHGAQVYGAPLRVGWAVALIELLQEILDAVAYAAADETMPAEDLAALVSLANRTTRRAIQSGVTLAAPEG